MRTPMNRCRAVLSALPLLALAACGGGGGTGPPPSGTSTCFYNVQGQLLSLSAAELASVNATLSAQNVATVGLQIGASSLLMLIEVPARALAPNEAVIACDTAVTVVLNKAIHAKNVCSGVEAVVYKQASAPGAITLKITKGFGSSGYHTVEFHKPGFAGVWVQIGEFDPGTFWSLAAGRNVTFTWLTE